MVMFVQFYEYTKTYLIVNFKWVIFMYMYIISQKSCFKKLSPSLTKG